MGIVLPFRPNRLLYPGSSPTFNSQHFAARNIARGSGFSAVSMGKQIVNLLGGSRFTFSGTPSASTNGAIGPVTTYTGASDYSLLSGTQAAATYGSMTVAAILQLNSVGAVATFLCVNSSAGNPAFLVYSSPTVFGLYSNGFVLSNVTASAGVPYFVAISYLSATVMNFAVTNLKTGQIFAGATGTGNAMSASNADLSVGGNFTFSQPLVGSLSAVMLANNVFLSIPQLRAWASDPWSFWYPQQFDLIDCLSVPVAAVAAAGSTLPFMGVG